MDQNNFINMICLIQLYICSNLFIDVNPLISCTHLGPIERGPFFSK